MHINAYAYYLHIILFVYYLQELYCISSCKVIVTHTILSAFKLRPLTKNTLKLDISISNNLTGTFFRYTERVVIMRFLLMEIH